MLNKRRFLATRIIYQVFIHCVGINLPLFFPVLQLAVLFLRQAALFRSGQCWSPAPGLPAHAGALRHISGDRHAHWDVCPGDYHTRAPCQRAVFQRGWDHPEPALLSSTGRQLFWRRDGGADVGRGIRVKPRFQFGYELAAQWRQASVLLETNTGREAAAGARSGWPEARPGKEATGETGRR